VAGALDVVCVLVFVVIGRSSHADGVTVAGVASTSWPFLVGAAVGWTAVRAWRQPMAIAPTGIVVWIACVTVGMVLRVVADQGTAAAFIAVALAFVGMELLGWRALARVIPSPHRWRGGAVGAAGSSDPSPGASDLTG
jgi:FtsH-binding integral membrane protein